MGYAFAISHCFGCGGLFSYNPVRVPSIRDPATGNREPICQQCLERVNPIRIANGLQPIIPSPDAYEPVDESDL